MTPFVEAARLLISGLIYRNQPPAFSHDGRDLVWRHHGLGMLQAELSETLRIHIWHPRLVSSGMAWPRCVHDHRFDITSAVIAGSIIDVPCIVTFNGQYAPSGGDDVRVYEIEHAKNQERMKGCSTAASASFRAQGRVSRCSEVTWAAGHEYRIPRRSFHTTRVEDLAITVVHRSNFDDRLARILCAPGDDAAAVSGIVHDDDFVAAPGWRSPLDRKVLCQWVLREAAGAIAKRGPS